MKKAIVAFSGGLDTTFCVIDLAQKGYQVITVTVNTGGFTKAQLKAIEKKAKALGAVKHYSVDAQEALFTQFANYIIKANYLKGGTYPACVGPERNAIAEAIVTIAKKEKIDTIVHGSTGAGNDQARFDVAFRALMPGVTILAPIRDQNLTREAEVALLKKAGIAIPAATKDYSINVGLMGTTIGGKETKGAEKELPDDVFPNVAPIDKAPGKPVIITIGFKKGVPVSFNHKSMEGPALIQKLNALGALHGFGKDYHLGTTIIGLKGRIGFEAPALKLLIKAHTELEKLVLTSKQLFWKNTLGTLYGDLIHEGLYYDPVVKNLEAFLDSASEYVTGEVTAKLYKGTLMIQSVKSPYSLLGGRFGTYGEKTGGWDGADAKGFCKLYGQESVNAHLIQHHD